MKDKDIYFLAEALRDHSVGDVATAVERDGCYCEDQYGRFMPVSDSEKGKVLGVLAECHGEYREWLELPLDFEPETHPYYGTPPMSRVDPIMALCDAPIDHPIWRYGWPMDSPPKFSERIGAGQALEFAAPLKTQERNTLLTIIAALCDYSAIKHQERGAASQIAKMTEEIGASVTDDTVRKVLARIPGALETRMK